MASLISHIHLALLRLVIVLVTLVVALKVSQTVQGLGPNIDIWNHIPVPMFFAGTIGLWAMLCIPPLRVPAIVAPHAPLHAFAQLGLALLGGSFVLFAALNAIHAPLVTQVTPFYMAPLLAIFIGGSVALLGIVGIMRALINRTEQDQDAFLPRMQAIHRRFGQLSACVAACVALVILASVLFVGRPTTDLTLRCALFLLALVPVLIWPRFDLPFIRQPNRLWHIAPQLLLIASTAHVFERITRAFGFHSQQFASFEIIDATYPALENLFMLPFIIFGMIGIGLALQSDAQPKPQPSEVFG